MVRDFGRAADVLRQSSEEDGVDVGAEGEVGSMLRKDWWRAALGNGRALDEVEWVVGRWLSRALILRWIWWAKKMPIPSFQNSWWGIPCDSP